MKLLALVLLAIGTANASRVSIDWSATEFTIQPGQTAWFGIRDGNLNGAQISLQLTGLMQTEYNATFEVWLRGTNGDAQMGWRDDPFLQVSHGGGMQTIENGEYLRWPISTLYANWIDGSYPYIDFGTAEFEVRNTSADPFRIGGTGRHLQEHMAVKYATMASGSWGYIPTYVHLDVPDAIQTDVPTVENPEPSTVGLMLIGCGMMVRFRSRRYTSRG